MVSVFTQPDVNTREVGRTLDKLETTPLRVVVSYAYLVFSQPFYISSQQPASNRHPVLMWMFAYLTGFIQQVEKKAPKLFA